MRTSPARVKERPAPLDSMGSLSGAREQRILKAAQELIAKEIEELTESALGIPQRELVKRALLGGDDQLGEELRRRFEQGKLSGKFRLLSGYLSDIPDEEKEEFFRSGWLNIAIPPPEPPKPFWDYAPYNGDQEWYREDLYSGIAFAANDLCVFAQEWIEELERVGYHGVRGPLRLLLKERIAWIIHENEFY